MLLETSEAQEPDVAFGRETRMVREEGVPRVVAELIEPVLVDLGYRLVRVRMTAENGQTLQIMAEKPDGSMTIEDCEAVSRVVSPILDVEDPVSGEYHLEVSSPGLDRPLVRLGDFDRWSGHVARFELVRSIDGRRRFRGTIKGVTGGSVGVAVEGDVEIVLAFEDIAEAKLVMTDELFRLALKRQEDRDEEDLD